MRKSKKNVYAITLNRTYQPKQEKSVDKKCDKYVKLFVKIIILIFSDFYKLSTKVLQQVVDNYFPPFLLGVSK